MKASFLLRRAAWLVATGGAVAASAAIVIPQQGLPEPTPSGGKAVTGTPPTTLQNSIRRPVPVDTTAALSALAMAGDVEAMFSLGSYFHSSAGVPQASAQALRWWEMAAKAGHPKAMAAYGYMLGGVNGGPRDLSGARQWLEQAQYVGVVRATYLLALVESAATGPKQESRARALLEQAAKEGDFYAVNDLAVELELEGKAVEATALYGRAAKAGVVPARQNLQRLKNNQKDQGVESLSRLQKRAAGGHADAMLQLAQRYHMGQGVRRDYARAITYYRNAADAGSAEARVFLALIFSRNGEGNAAADGAWMQEVAARINAAAMWSEQRNDRPLDRPARIEDPLADFAVGGPTPSKRKLR